MDKIIYKDLSYKISGLCFKIHNELGRFCREKQYADKLEDLLKQSGIKYQREYEIKNIEINSPRGNRIDFLIDDKMILDFKAKGFITKDDYFQMQRYLRCAKLKLGLIINFHQYYLKPKRILNTSL